MSFATEVGYNERLFFVVNRKDVTVGFYNYDKYSIICFLYKDMKRCRGQVVKAIESNSIGVTLVGSSPTSIKFLEV